MSEQNLSKQEIFQQIQSDLMSNTLQDHIPQKTKHNYRFVIFLDLIALLIAMIGGYLVYNVFREQQIRLVEGQGAVRTLELSVIQQLQKQNEKDFFEKEQALLNAQNALREISSQFNQEKLSLQEQNQINLQNQRLELEAQYREALRSATGSEQAEIQRQYELDLARLEQEAQNSLDRQIQEYQSRFDEQQSQRQSELEQLRQQLGQVEEKLATTKSTLTKTQAQRPEVVIQTVENAIDKEIARLFLLVQESLQNNDFSNIARLLSQIEQQITLNTDTVKQNSDRFIVQTIKNYIQSQTNQLIPQNTQEIQALNAVVTELTNDINGLREQIVVLQISNQLINEQLIQNEQQLVQREEPVVVQQPENVLYDGFRNAVLNMTQAFQRREDVNRQLRVTSRENSEIADLLISQSNYFIQNDTAESEELLAKAESNFADGKYDQSGENYQAILRLYPNTTSRDRAVEGLYKSIEFSLRDKNAVLVDRLLPDLQVNEPTKETFIPKIVYLQMPSGYVADILNDRLIVMLTPSSRIKSKENVLVLRMQNLQALRLEEITNMRISTIDGRYATVEGAFPDIKLGDLIYQYTNK